MKIIFFLVLAGLSLSNGFDCIQKYQPASTLQCLQNVLTITPKFLEKWLYFLCNYEEGIKNNKKEFEDALRELIEILKCAGCAVDELIGTKNTIDELKLTGPVANLACNLIKGLGLVDLVGVLGGLFG